MTYKKTTKNETLESVSTALYIRCSTKEQKFEAQQEDLIRFAKSKGWSNVKIFSEKVSGVASKRPVFSQMIEEVKQGNIERVCVYDLSRLSRKGVADVIETINFLQKHNVELISKKEGISFEGQMGLVMASLFSAFGNIDYCLRKEKCELGRQRIREQNNGVLPWTGRGGRKKNTEKRSAIVKMKATGATYREISKVLGVSPTTIRRALAETA